MQVMFLVFSAVLADASGLSDDSPDSTTQVTLQADTISLTAGDLALHTGGPVGAYH